MIYIFDTYTAMKRRVSRINVPREKSSDLSDLAAMGFGRYLAEVHL